jgi:photosystem II stability/assembly factor-like uncharacterized protein
MLRLGIFNLLKLRVFIGVFGAFALVLAGALAGCKKHKKQLSLEPEVLNSPTQQAIHKSTWLDASTGFICGGEKNKSGFIYKTSDAGNSWRLIYSAEGKCIYDIKFVNDTIAYACGDQLLVLNSKNNGDTWTEVSFANVNLQYFNYAPMRCIFGNYNLLMIVGGENYHNGNALWFENNTMRWVWHFDHEFRTGLDFDPDNFVLAGYGNAYRSNDHGYTYTATDLAGDYFTSSATLNSSLGYACGYDGGIYKTEDAGASWQTLLKPNSVAKKRIHFNGMCFKDANNGWAVGNKGLIMGTTNGEHFDEYNTISEADLLSISLDKMDRMIITASDGKLYRFTN